MNHPDSSHVLWSDFTMAPAGGLTPVSRSCSVQGNNQVLGCWSLDGHTSPVHLEQHHCGTDALVGLVIQRRVVSEEVLAGTEIPGGGGGRKLSNATLSSTRTIVLQDGQRRGPV